MTTNAPMGAGSRSSRNVKLELTSEQKRDLEEAFRLFDYEGIGAIDPKELIVAYRALGFEPKHDELKRVIQEYEDQNGKIPLNGFMAIFSMKMSEPPTLDEILKGYKVSILCSILSSFSPFDCHVSFF